MRTLLSLLCVCLFLSVSCGKGNDARMVENAPVIEVSLKQIHEGVSRMSSDQRDEYLFRLEGYRVTWTGTVKKVFQPEGSESYYVQVTDPGLPNSLIYLLMSQSDSKNLITGQEIKYDGLISDFSYDKRFALSVSPVILIEEGK